MVYYSVREVGLAVTRTALRVVRLIFCRDGGGEHSPGICPPSPRHILFVTILQYTWDGRRDLFVAGKLAVIFTIRVLYLVPPQLCGTLIDLEDTRSAGTEGVASGVEPEPA